MLDRLVCLMFRNVCLQKEHWTKSQKTPKFPYTRMHGYTHIYT